MMFRDVVTLSAIVETQNTYGEIIETATTKSVMADKQSVKRTEFYQAMTAGFKPEVVFVIKSCEYSNQPKLTHESINYEVIRTFTVDNECIELICQRGVK